MSKVWEVIKGLISKVSLKAVAIMAIVFLAVYAGFTIKSYFANKELANYQRQLAGDLTAKEQQIEAANAKLGIAQSQLVTQKDLNAKLQSDKDALSKEYAQFKKDHNLIVKSKDETIAQLQAQINGGTSVVTNSCVLPKDCVIGYTWQDTYKRFQLKVPNILIQGNEVFTNSQLFRIEGEIDSQQAKDGFLEARRVTMAEVYATTDKDGKVTYIDIPGSNVNVIDSKFYYANSPAAKTDSFFNPRLIVLGLYDFHSFKPALGIELVHYHNFGLNSFTAIDTQTFANSAQHIGVLWSPKLFGSIPVNFGIGPSVGTEFSNLFKTWVAGLDVAFYLND